MSRLPVPAGDEGVWGDILNDFLLVEHNGDGTHKLAANPDASTTVKGKVKLAGDLSGTADLPTVPGLAGKEPTITAGTTSQYWRGDKTWAALTAATIGLGNVDNTSDANKPVSSATQTALNAKVGKGDLVRNVRDYGATGDGATDDTAAINAALAALPEGYTLFFPAGVYMISSRITINRNQTIQGTHSPRWAYDSFSPSVIKAMSSFSDTCMIYAGDMELLGKSQETDGGRILNIAIDGDNVGSGINGMFFEGQCRDWKLMDCSVSNVTGSGIRTVQYNRVGGQVHPKGFALHRIAVYFAHNNGYSFNNTTDSIFFDCLAVSCFANGFFITGAGENQFFCCRAVFNGSNGFTYTGAHTGAVFSSCTTDRNDKHGFNITATGAYPVVLYGFVSRRDGRNANAGGGGYAGINVAGTGSGNLLASPVWIAGVIQSTGVDDNDTGVNSPNYGVKAAWCRFLYIDGLLWGDAESYHDAGNNVIVRFGPNTYSTTGTDASPTRDTTTRTQTYEGATSAGNVLNSQVTSDTNKRWNLYAGGKMEWGPGTAATDTNLYRQSTGLLQSDHRIKAIDGITTKTKAGAVTDADFTNTPQDGTLAVDTTNSVLYLRAAGAWTSVGSAASQLAPQSLTLRSSSETWTSMPAGLTEYLGGTTRRLKWDLTNVTQARLQVSLTTAGSAGSSIAIQYSSDGGTNWFYLDNSSGPTCAITSTGLTVSSWVTITAGAKSDVLLRIVGSGGNGSTSPVFVNVVLQVKP